MDNVIEFFYRSMPRTVRRTKNENIESFVEEICDELRNTIQKEIEKMRKIFNRYLQTRVKWLRMAMMSELEGRLDMNFLSYCQQYAIEGLPECYRVAKSPAAPSTIVETFSQARTAASRITRRQARPATDTDRTTTRTKRATNAQTLKASTPRSISVPPSTVTKTLRNRRRAAGATVQKPSAVFKHQSPVKAALECVNLLDRRDSVVFSSHGTPIRNPFGVISSNRLNEIASEEVRSIRTFISSLNSKLPSIPNY
uniref:Uncharacterized protein n=1 Tax=Schistocephalus solidus TaxID=70667 RepID=A0A0X3P5A2_SCHSO